MNNITEFDKLNTYKENNCVEAKLAAGGFPQSLWKTYSAFANTGGGIMYRFIARFGKK